MDAVHFRGLTKWVKTASYRSIKTMNLPPRETLSESALKDYDDFIAARDERLRVIVDTMYTMLDVVGCPK